MEKRLHGSLCHEVQHLSSSENHNSIVSRISSASAAALHNARPDSVLENLRQLQFRPQKIFLQTHGRWKPEQHRNPTTIVRQVDPVVSSGHAQYRIFTGGEDIQGVLY